MNNPVEQGKIIKHGATGAPLECAHCGCIWYGYATGNKLIPGITFCSRCWEALDSHLWRKYDRPYHENKDEAVQAAQSWAQDKNKIPRPRSATRRFHKSVPKWIRTAITSGMMRTDSKDVYVIYSRDGVAFKVEIVDQSKLKPFKIR